MTGHWMHHFVLSKLVLFTALLTQGVKKAEIISSPSDLPSPDWLTALTVSTNSNFFLSWTSWMRQTYSSAALAKSLCSISRVASAWKTNTILEMFYEQSNTTKFSYIIMMTMNSVWLLNPTHLLCNNFSSIFCVYGWLWVIIATLAETSSWPAGSIAVCHLPVASSVYTRAICQYSNKCTSVHCTRPVESDFIMMNDTRKRPPKYQTDEGH